VFNRISKINKLTNITNININKKDNIYKSLLNVAIQTRYNNIITILLNYKINIYKSFSLLNAI